MIGLVARSENKVIGKNGKLPWHCSEDLKFFKRMTMGKSLLMGFNTYRGMPLIQGRSIYVLVKQVTPIVLKPYQAAKEAGQEVHLIPNVQYCKFDLQESIKRDLDNFVLCGGGKTYAQFAHLCSEFYVSVIKGEYEGDTFFDDSWLKGFEFASNLKVSDQLSIQKYLKKLGQ